MLLLIFGPADHEWIGIPLAANWSSAAKPLIPPTLVDEPTIRTRQQMHNGDKCL
jgi:hypothetical protein